MRRLALTVIALSAFCHGCTTSLAKILREEGYEPVRPASTLLEPGVIVVGLGNQRWERICTQSDSVGPIKDKDHPEGIFKLADSTIPHQSLIEKVSRSLDIDADYLAQLKASAKYHSVRSIKCELTNAKVWDADRTNVRKAAEHFRDPDCEKEIDTALSDGEEVTMIRSVLQADVVYSVEFEESANLTVEAKQALLKGLSLSLGVSEDTATTDTVSGSNLFWGAIDQPKGALYRRTQNPNAVPGALGDDATLPTSYFTPNNSFISVIEASH